jgi:hypothetical protein
MSLIGSFMVQLYPASFYSRWVFIRIAAKGIASIPVFGDRLRSAWPLFFQLRYYLYTFKRGLFALPAKSSPGPLRDPSRQADACSALLPVALSTTASNCEHWASSILMPSFLKNYLRGLSMASCRHYRWHLRGFLRYLFGERRLLSNDQ